MPEFTALHLAMLACLFAIGTGLGWLLRGDRCAREKIAINAGWQEQLETWQAENDQLTEQNHNLVRQASEHQASDSGSDERDEDPGASLEQALRQRDELQRQLEELRGRVDSARAECERLRKELEGSEARLAAGSSALEEKDRKISRLSRHLRGWQERVPPLVEKFRQREQEMRELQTELDRAVNRIAELEAMTRLDETRIEAIEDGALGELDASNDQYGDNAQQDLAGLEDQVDLWPESRSGDEESFDATPADDAGCREAVNAGSSAAGRDDLQRIEGVDPAIEITLNELGIYRFDQIADISEHEIDRVDARLHGFRSRIYRENWIGQARALTQAKPPDPE